MAYAMTKRGSQDNIVTYEFICDAISDMNTIENRYRTIGSVAVVLEGEGGGMEAYIAGSDKQWNNLGSLGASNSGSSSSTGGLSIIPDPPTTDGTYTLQATVTSGVITYTWVAGA